VGNLGKLLDSIHAGVVVIDADENIVVLNQQAGEMLGQNPDSRIGSSILLCHPERAEPGVLKMIGQMKSGELKEYEGWVNFAGRILYEYIYPLWDEDGNYNGAVAELHDAAEKAEYLKSQGDWKAPEMHGLGESAPRSPHPESTS
jgi:PAS domain S-box-containing protein